LLNELEAAGRDATPDEQKILAQYVGWGGIPQVFDENKADWAKEYQELNALMTPDEYIAARRSTQDAHYTSKPVVQAIWSGLEKLGLKGGYVLEPSMGTGNFFGLMPPHIDGKLTGVELDPLTTRFAKKLYPNAQIYNRGFQDYFIEPGSFDAAIGNPPFGAQSIYDRYSKELSAMKIHGYFFAKSVDSLRPGGVLGMVVSKGLLDAGDPQARDTREYLSRAARLLGAIRLPNNAFQSNANTEVTTDIIFLQKIDPENGVEANPEDWLEVGEIPDEATGEPIRINKYFVDHPEQMLGKMTLEGSMYRDNEPTLSPIPGADITDQLAKAITSLPEKVITDRTITRDDYAGQKSLADYPGMRPFNLGVDKFGGVYHLIADLNGNVSERPQNLTGKRSIASRE
jgi:hypothetical protein